MFGAILLLLLLRRSGSGGPVEPLPHYVAVLARSGKPTALLLPAVPKPIADLSGETDG